MLRNFTPRLYQQTILGTVARHNTLVVLPTGLGKTAIAFLLTAQRLNNYPNSKILLLAPTKPLCEQHVESFREHLDIPAEKIVLFTGSVSPEKRALLWKDAQIIISTPQGLENDIINSRINLKEVSLLIFDEAHHATGEYAYVWIANQYDKTSSSARILALTASPGSDMETVKEVTTNLKIEKVEVRTEKDVDVKPYVQTTHKKWVEVEFPQELKQIQLLLKDCRKSKLIEAQHLGYCSDLEMSKGGLLALQLELQKKITSGFRDFELLRSLSVIAEAMKIDHALELLETQGIRQLHSYFKKMQQDALTSKVKAVQNLMQDELFKSSMHFTEELLTQNVEHPKLPKLREIIRETMGKDPNAKTIIFTQFRDSAEEIVKTVSELNIKNHLFVGQTKKNGSGFSQKQQKEILDKFSVGEFNILVATSVAEEGLDIPKVDKVIFYEPIPSAIRSIQRRGRTGRLEDGEVTILLTKGTRDEAYRWSAHHKEKRMYRNLDQLKKEFSLHKNEQTLTIGNNTSGNNASLTKFMPQEKIVAVLADHREKNNRVVKELIDAGIPVKTAQLTSADYIVSGKVGIELKKVPDFVASIIDGRILDQVRDLKNSFPKAVLVIEGEEDIYTIRNVHANAIRGMLASIVLDFHVPVLYTKNPQDTAALLVVMAKREQGKEIDFSPHSLKPKSVCEQQEFIVSSFPNIGMQTARILLEHFSSIKNLVNASEAQLTELKGIGDKTARQLVKMFEEEYLKKST
ncbi:DEAD/DEAH box helicase [Candidatus Woesearchaeota archaeon]|nr:DEAD/DEAH box helicase [Candidatus Woesearchaeota archaeon]